MSKRLPPASWTLVSVVLLLLPWLAVLQFRWLGQLSDSEKERMNALLHSAALQFAGAFDAEITRAYSVFQPQEALGIANLAEDYSQRFDRWETASSHPKLVRNVFLAEISAHGEVGLVRVNPTTRSLEPIEWPQEITALRQQITQSVFDPLSDKPPALIIRPEDAFGPIQSATSTSRPHLLAAIVLLDSDYITRVFLPALIGRYFSPEHGLSYDIAVVSGGPPRKPIFESGPHLLSKPRNGVETPLFDLHLESLLNGDANGNVGVPRVNHPPMVVRIIKSPREMLSAQELGGRWRLLASYKSGSLEDKIADSRAGNLAIGFGILLLFAVSIALLMVSSARATRLAQAQIRFVAGVTHELRTPLGVICSAGENLADGIVTEPGKVKEYGRVIRDDGRRLGRMVEEVLEYTGAQSGRQVYEFRPTDIQEVYAAAMAELREEVGRSGITIDTQFERNLPRIWADFAALKRALQNLISNSIKYDTGQGRITISARRRSSDRNEVQITVADRGRGISRSELPRIFEPFFRGNDATADQIKGSGLGLSLVQHTVKDHGGRVTVESTLGVGSSFTIHLPVARTVH